MMSEKRYGVHDCPNGFYYLRDVTDHSVYIHRNYGYLYSPYQEDIELVSTLLNELADKVDEQQATIESLQTELELVSGEKLFSRRELERKVKEQQATITELKEKLKLEQDFASRWQKESEMLAKENEQLRRYVYHCPQICNKILAYLGKCETEDVKAVNDAMGDDKYFDEEIDNLRSWE